MSFRLQMRITGEKDRAGACKICLDPPLPGFLADQGSERLAIEVGILPGGNLFFREADKYITLEETTRRILDRALFPKLKD
jgi:hypothetical protein